MASFALAAFSLTLPATPPGRDAQAANAPLEAIRFLAVPAILVLFVVTFMDALVHQAYFQLTSPFRAGRTAGELDHARDEHRADRRDCDHGGPGRGPERYGWRTTMAVGIAAHALRFRVRDRRSPVADGRHQRRPRDVLRVFFAAVYIFVDEYFPKDSRASAQGLFSNLLILGLGPFFGNLLWGRLADSLRTGSGDVDYQTLFQAPAWLAVAAMVLLLVAFRPSARVA